MIPPTADDNGVITTLSNVIKVRFTSTVQNPVISTDISIMLPTSSPIISPLLLFIRAAIYPPKYTLIAIIATDIYSITSNGGKDEDVNTIVVIHINIAMIHTDATTPSIKAL